MLEGGEPGVHPESQAVSKLGSGIIRSMLYQNNMVAIRQAEMKR